MKLTDIAVKNLKFTGKPTKHADAKGLYMLVTAAGKYWRLDYRFADKRKTLALGTYPSVSLAMARELHKNAKAELVKKVDPGEAKKQSKAEERAKHASTFAGVAKAWMKSTAEQRKPVTEAKLQTWMDKYVLPEIGKKPVSEVKPVDALRVLAKMDKAKIRDSLGRVYGVIGRVMRYAVAQGLAPRDVTRDLELKDLYPPRKAKHHAAIIEPAPFGGLLRAIQGYQPDSVAGAALRLAPLLFCRPGELRAMEWAELDLDAGLWSIPEGKMKMGVAHIVPLARQAVAILRAIHDQTGHGKYVFPSNRGQGRPMSENTINGALRALGYGPDVHVGHGFRASARTMLDQNLRQDVRVIELQLAHLQRDANGQAYNRTSFLPERVVMMQVWADYCDQLREGGQVIPMVRAA